MAQTRCPRCSEELSDKVAICPHCGYLLHGPAPEAPSATNPPEVRPDVPKLESKPEPVKSASASLRRDESASPASAGPLRDKTTAPPNVERFRQIYAEQGATPALKYWHEEIARLKAKTSRDREKKAGRISQPPKHSLRHGCLVALVVGFLFLVLSTVLTLLDSSRTHFDRPRPAGRISHHRH